MKVDRNMSKLDNNSTHPLLPFCGSHGVHMSKIAASASGRKVSF